MENMLTNEQKLALIREKVFQLRPKLASFNYEWEEELLLEDEFHVKRYCFIFLNREMKMRFDLSVVFADGICQPGSVSRDSISPWLWKPRGLRSLSFEPAGQRRDDGCCLWEYCKDHKLPLSKYVVNMEPVREFEPFMNDFFSELERGLNTYLMELMNGIKWQSVRSPRDDDY